MGPIRDRVRELRRVRAGELLPNPRNWRKHPDAQQTALRAVLDEVGFAGALIARECDDGRLELIDGHLRAATLPDTEVPVLVVDLTADEARLLLAVHDPIAAMAETDVNVLADVLTTIEIRHAAIADMLEEILQAGIRGAAAATTEVEPRHDAAPPRDASEPAPPELRESFQLLVECTSEAEQRILFERLVAEGRKCRVLTL